MADTYTQADLTAIKKAIASGHLVVSINGRSVTYRNLADMVRAKRLIEQELSGSTTRMTPRYQVATFNDG